MEEYRVDLYTKSQASLDQIKNMILSLHKLGYSFKYKGTHFSPEQAFNFLFNENGTLEFVKNYTDYFYGYMTNKKLCMYSSFLRSSALIEFKHGIDPNTISMLKFFLHFTESFLLIRAKIKSDLEHFSNLKPTVSNEVIDQKGYTTSEKKQANDQNAIHAYVLVCEKEFISDALDIINLAKAYGYKFIDNPKNQNMLDSFETLESLKEKFPSDLYLMVDNFIMKFIFNGPLISLYPIEPYKMKIADNQIGIDIAFYLNIYLNLVEEFGIDDLITTFKEQS